MKLDLAPRSKEQRTQENELSTARVQVEAEAEMLVQRPNQVDGDMIKAHARNLKTFLKTFIKRIDIRGSEATIRYTLPVPPQARTSDRVSVLPIDNSVGWS